MAESFVFLSVYALWAAVHSLTQSRACKLFFARILGPRFAYYRLAFTLASLASFALAMVLAPRLPLVLYQAHGPAAWGLWAVRLLAALFFIWTFEAFNVLDFTGIRQVRDYPSGKIGLDGETAASEKLTVTGPYRIVRHPMYLAASVFLFAEPDMTLEKLLFAVFATTYFWIGSIFEERRLVAVFGVAYLEYQKTTPRMLPHLRRSR